EYAVQRMLTGAAGRLPTDRDVDVDTDVAPLLRVAEALRDLPYPRFRAQLKADLNNVALERTVTMTPEAETVTLRQTATPRLRVRNAAAAIEFYKNAFGAQEVMRFVGHGQIVHAELAIVIYVVMLGEGAH